MKRVGPALALGVVLLGLSVPRGAAAQVGERIELDLGQGVRLDLVRVARGSFRQGSAETEADRNADEIARTVQISRDFYLGAMPVLRGQFARFVAATGYRTEAETGRSGGYGLEGGRLVQRPRYTWRDPGFAQTDTHPVVLVTYGDAEAFAVWLTRQSGRRVRLPTEAEWEYACRAGTSTAYFAGEGAEIGRTLGYFREAGGTHEARGRPANAWGLYDMVGHVQQWVQDWYGPYEAMEMGDPVATAPGSPPGQPDRRVLRGGSFLRETKSGRCAARGRSTPGSRNADTGFRVVAELLEPPAEGSSAIPSATVPMPLRQGHAPARRGRAGPVVCIALTGLLAAAIAYLLRRAQRGFTRATDARGGPYRALQLVPQADGFRVIAPVPFDGQTLRYRYRARGQRYDCTVRLEPGSANQFVYTGETPTELELVALGAIAMDGVGAQAMAPGARNDAPRSDDSDDASAAAFVGYPPAY